ncbi:hypothetical protein VTI28DRAFT_7747 [Corynascus sepedonium]
MPTARFLNGNRHVSIIWCRPTLGPQSLSPGSVSLRTRSLPSKSRIEHGIELLYEPEQDDGWICGLQIACSQAVVVTRSPEKSAMARWLLAALSDDALRHHRCQFGFLPPNQPNHSPQANRPTPKNRDTAADGSDKSGNRRILYGKKRPGGD